MSWTVLVVCKVENAGNAVKLIRAVVFARLFPTIISRSKHNLLNVIRVCLGPLLYGSPVDIHLHFLFICLCAVTKQAEGKEHGLHMPEGLCYVNRQTRVGKRIQLGIVIAQMNEDSVNSL